MLTFGSIINGAFRHFRERPLAVLTWGAVYTAITFTYSLVLMPTMARQMAEMQNGSPPPAAFFGMMLPLYLFMLVLVLVLTAASMRTILRPEESRFAGLRFGMDELRLLGLILLLMIGFSIIATIGIIVVGLIGGVLAVAAGGSGAVALLVILPMLALYGGLLFLAVRLSLVSALTVLRRKVVIGESWRLTKGHFWRLFGAFFVLGVMLAVLYGVVAAIIVGPALGDMIAHRFSPESLQAFSQAQLQRQLGGLSVMTIVSAIGNGLLVAISYAVWGGAAATAAQGLIGTTDVDLAETFA